MAKNNKIGRSLYANLEVYIKRIKGFDTPFGVDYPRGTMILEEDSFGYYASLDNIRPFDTLNTIDKIQFAESAGASVTSVFGRTGIVVAQAGDYNAFYYTEAEVDAKFGQWAFVDNRLDWLTGPHSPLQALDDTTIISAGTSTIRRILLQDYRNSDIDAADNSSAVTKGWVNTQISGINDWTRFNGQIYPKVAGDTIVSNDGIDVQGGLTLAETLPLQIDTIRTEFITDGSAGTTILTSSNTFVGSILQLGYVGDAAGGSFSASGKVQVELKLLDNLNVKHLMELTGHTFDGEVKLLDIPTSGIPLKNLAFNESGTIMQGGEINPKLSGLERFTNGGKDGWRLIDSLATTTGDDSVNLTATRNTTQDNIVLLNGTEYVSYTTTEINNLPDSKLGTFVFNSTLDSLVQCVDATPSSNVWRIIGDVTSDSNFTSSDRIIRAAATDKSVKDSVVTISDAGAIAEILSLEFTNGETITWNDDFKTINIPSGTGSILQAGQEFWFLVYNDTGVEIVNGSVLKPVAAFLVGTELIPTVRLAQADSWDNCNGTLFVATSTIGIGELGMVTRIGRVSDVNTIGLAPGADLYLSPTVAGGITDIRPSFPNYIISIGGALEIAGSGVIVVSFTTRVQDTLLSSWDGGFRESIDLLVTSNGTVTTGSLDRSGGSGGDLTMLFSDGFSTLDCTPPQTVVLTDGTDTLPVKNYIFVPQSTKTLTVNTTGWPTTEHIKVADVVLKSATDTQASGALANRNWNDHVKSTDDNGHLLHIAERLRQNPAAWSTGTEGQLTIVGGTDAYASITSGTVYQLHKQSFPALDMQTGDHADVVNDSVSPYVEITNLNSITLDATGTSLSNRGFNIVLWGVQSKSGEDSHMMINLPAGSYTYNSTDDTQADTNGYAVYDMPDIFTGTGFLIARFNVRVSGGVWELLSITDLRGKLPNTTAGASPGGGGGATDFTALLDTPSSYIGHGTKPLSVTAGEDGVEFVDTLEVGAINVNQLADDVGIQINGFDDHSDKNIRLSIRSNGRSNIGGDSEMYMSPQNADVLFLNGTGVFIFDNKNLIFGIGADFYQKYNSTSGKLELSDGTNIFQTVEDLGTTAKFDFFGDVEVSNTLTIGNVPSGIQTSLLGIDASGNVIQGTGTGGKEGIYETVAAFTGAGINTALAAGSQVYLPAGSYDISDVAVTVPAGSVLRFEEGAVITGSNALTGNGTKIEANKSQIFNIALDVQGTWDITEAYPEWFGATGVHDDGSDAGIPINKCTAVFGRVDLDKDSWYDIGTTIESTYMYGNFAHVSNTVGNATTPIFNISTLPVTYKDIKVRIRHYSQMTGGALANGYTGRVFELTPRFTPITDPTELVVGRQYRTMSNTTGDLTNASTPADGNNNNVGDVWTYNPSGAFTMGDAVLMDWWTESEYRYETHLFENVTVAHTRTMGEPNFAQYSYTGMWIKPQDNGGWDDMYWAQFKGVQFRFAGIGTEIDYSTIGGAKPQSTQWVNCIWDYCGKAIHIHPDADGHSFVNCKIQPIKTQAGVYSEVPSLVLESSYNDFRLLIWDIHYEETVIIESTAAHNVIEFQTNFASAELQEPNDFVLDNSPLGNNNYIGYNPLWYRNASGDYTFKYAKATFPNLIAEDFRITESFVVPDDMSMPVEQISETDEVSNYAMNGTTDYFTTGAIGASNGFHKDMFLLQKFRVPVTASAEYTFGYNASADTGRGGMEVRIAANRKIRLTVAGSLARDYPEALDFEIPIDEMFVLGTGFSTRTEKAQYGYFYKNGLLKEARYYASDLGIINSTYDAAINIGARFNGGTQLEQDIQWVMLANFFPTDREIQTWSGNPYAVPFKYRGADNTRLTSGTLEIGKEYVFTVGRTEEITDITTVADVATSLNNTYFNLSSAGDITDYYVWYNVDGGGTDPAIALKTGIEVAIVEDDSADAVALATQLAIDAIADFSATVSTSTVTITTTYTGQTTDATDGTAATGFTINVTQQGLTGGNFGNVGAYIEKTDGDLVVNALYYIVSGSSGDFSNVGSSVNPTPGTSFTATGATPTNWGNYTLRQYSNHAEDFVFVALETTPTSWGDSTLIQQGMVVHNVGGKTPGKWNNSYGGKTLTNVGAPVVQNEIPVQIPVLATAPASPYNGMIYVNSTDNKSYVRTGGAWVDITESGGDPAITDSQVVVGTGTGVEGTTELTFDGDDLAVRVNATAPSIILENTNTSVAPSSGGAQFVMISSEVGAEAEWRMKTVGTTGGFKFRDQTNGKDVIVMEPNTAANAIYVKAGGNVGIQNTDPTRELDVNGGAKISGVTEMGGAVHKSYATIATTQTLGDKYYYYVSGLSVTLTLPTGADYDGREYVIVNEGANAVTIAAASGSVSGGSTSLAAGSTAVCHNKGTAAWNINITSSR